MCVYLSTQERKFALWFILSHRVVSCKIWLSNVATQLLVDAGMYQSDYFPGKYGCVLFHFYIVCIDHLVANNQ